MIKPGIICALVFILLSVSVSAADIRGYVVDDKDNLIRHAEVNVYCGPDEYSMNTNQFGAFEVYDVAGNCSIVVIKDNIITTKDLFVEGINIYVVKITLNFSKSNISMLWLIPLFIVVVSVSFFLIRKFITSKSTRDKTSIKEPVAETLVGNEKIIADQLCKGPLTHSQLRHYTGLPKSTIHRVLCRLQTRSIVFESDDAGVKKWELSETIRK